MRKPASQPVSQPSVSGTSVGTWRPRLSSEPRLHGDDLGQWQNPVVAAHVIASRRVGSSNLIPRVPRPWWSGSVSIPSESATAGEVPVPCSLCETESPHAARRIRRRRKGVALPSRVFEALRASEATTEGFRLQERRQHICRPRPARLCWKLAGLREECKIEDVPVVQMTLVAPVLLAHGPTAPTGGQ